MSPSSDKEEEGQEGALGASSSSSLDGGVQIEPRGTKFIAGALGGSASAFALSPFDVVRTRMQVQATLPATVGANYHTISACVRSIWKQEGVRGFYRGYIIASVLVPSFWAIYFPLYEALKPVMHTQCQHVFNAQSDTRQVEDTTGIDWKGEVLPQASAAGIAGLVGDIVTYPMWTVRTRLQTNYLHELSMRLMDPETFGSAPRKRKIRLSTTMVSTIVQVYKDGGIPNFYRGLPAALFGTLHTAIQFPIYEMLKRRLHSAAEEKYPSTNEKARFAAVMIASSSVSKLFASVFTYPFELVRSRLQDDRAIGSRPCRYRSSWHAFADIWRKESWRGFYSGFNVNLARTLPACAITFTTYELVSYWMKRSS
eukprot:gb/GECG01016170.1/.p1 GENE.gb/GECG01016170.1/~~gb/GECG01016170.1/.p1  ORF type:complete len:369 (+),score=32.11 gb/GECG01016170.1/:1-1107(+)